MRGDKIIFNGELYNLTGCANGSGHNDQGNIVTNKHGDNSNGFDFDRLLSGNYVYQAIHVSDYRALNIDDHLRIAAQAFKVMYGRELEIDAVSVQEAIERLFKANLYRELSYEVRLYIFEDDYALSCIRQLLYHGYTLWHSRPTAIIVPYENPLSGYPNASSLISATFAAGFAKRSGEDAIAITENYDHVLVGVGDNPLFAVKDEQLLTTPIKYGATHSVERFRTIKAAHKAGLRVIERPLLHNEIATYDELFTVDVQGVISVFSCEQTTFFGLVAERVSKFY